MSAPTRPGCSPVSPTGLAWWTVNLVLEAPDGDRKIECTFLALNEEGARLRGVSFAESEKQRLKSLIVTPAKMVHREGRMPCPEAFGKDVQAPLVQTDPPREKEKPKVTPEQARAIAAFTLVSVNMPTVRLYTSEGGKT